MTICQPKAAVFVSFFLTAAVMTRAAELIQEQPFLPATFGEAGKAFATRGAQRAQVIADRKEYFADEVNGQFLVCFIGVVKPEGDPTLRIALALKDADGRPLMEKTVAPVLSPKLPLIVPTIELKPGRYELTASLQDKEGKTLQTAGAAFTRSERQEPRAPFPPEGVAIAAHPQGHAPDAAWPVSTGVPLPKFTFKDASEFALLENGRPVPAQFSVRATWSPRGYAKWLGVDFIVRYDKGVPREYRLVRDPARRVVPERPLKVEEAPDAFTVDTGAVKFIVGKKFAGIEKAWLDRNRDGQYGDDELLVSGKGGAFVVDRNGVRYESALSPDGEVAAEDAGPLRVTLAAKGAYANEKGETLCRYAVRLTAYAGQPFVHVSHRMINTIADLWDDNRLADVGFEVVPNGALAQWRFGLDGAAREGKPAAAESVFLHQDRDDRLRVMRNDALLGEGKRSDGWCSGSVRNGAVTFHLRDAWQKFPKEFEFDLAAGGAGKMVVHFWPKHGHVAFTEQEELAREQIYKVRWAHQGKLLELRIPDNYHRTLADLEKTEPWAGGDGQLVIVNRQGQTKMQAAGGQGTVIGNEMMIWFDDAAPSAADLTARGALVQQAPHALSDPRWNAATRVYGDLAARDAEKFPAAEKMLDTAYAFYRKAIIEGTGEFGQWIYGAVHSSWDPKRGAADMKRVWQMCHYQNVFQAWLLYFRSGSPEHYAWARMHADQHVDVGVDNYTKYPPGKHSYSHFPAWEGNIYHCKGFMPWAGNSSLSGHWIDIANYFSRYYLMGDRRGLDMAEAWLASQGIMGIGAPPNVVPSTPDGFRDNARWAEAQKFVKDNPGLKADQQPQWVREELAKPPPFNPREVFVPLGEYVQYYQGTWDPQALIHLSDHAEYLNCPFIHTNSPSLADFGKHWHEWHYNLTRDPRVVDRVREYMEQMSTPDSPAASSSFAAFLYHATGETKYLAPAADKSFQDLLNIYENPDDPWHGFCMAHSNPAAMLFGRLPYLLHAVDAAGLRYAPTPGVTTLPQRSGRMDAADKRIVPPRGWTNTGVTILARAETPCKVAVWIDGPTGYGSFRGFYQLFHEWPELNTFARPGATERVRREEQENIVSFPAENLFKDPPTQRNFTNRRGNDFFLLPYIERADNDPHRLFYRLELAGDNVDLPVLRNADTKAPLRQIAVIPRTVYWNAKVQESRFHAKGYVNAWFRPLEETPIQLKLAAVHARYSMPTAMKVYDAQGRIVIETSVFPSGRRTEAQVALDPKTHPIPWRMEMASSGDNALTFTGAEELFFAAAPEEFEAILPHVRVYKP